jgi:hemerythrin-like metal-binding protein
LDDAAAAADAVGGKRLPTNTQGSSRLPFSLLENSMEQSGMTPASGDAMGFGIPELDAADRKLSALVHELNQAIADGRDGVEIQRVMNLILLDAVCHFEHEERVLSECDYPLLKGHALLHLQMRAELEHAMDKFRDVEARAMWPEYGLLVAQIFVEHMRQEAIKYRKFLRSRSPSDSPRK